MGCSDSKGTVLHPSHREQLPILHTGTNWRKTDVTQLVLNNPGASWWQLAEKLVVDSMPDVNPDIKRRGWKTVRLFVSSTFKDMHSEREYLVKRVFPELRVWCEERKIRLIECDLRWGIPKSADTREILLACLSEIDRCYEENIYPYFLGLLSERYGWAPEPIDVPSDIQHRFKWIPGMSVTALETYNGAYWSRNPNALFLLRNSKMLAQIKDEDIKSDYLEDDETSAKSLAIFKEQIKSAFPEQVYEYNCHVEDIEEDRVVLAGLEDFGMTVLEHFKDVIAKQYPMASLNEKLSSLEIQREEHRTFMQQRSQIVLGRNALLKQIEDYIKQDNPTPLVLTGFAGAGKSALVAYIAHKASMDNRYQTFYHFVGATPGSTNLYRLLGRIWQELLPSDEQLPSDLNELKHSLETVLKKASKLTENSGKERVILMIDALNQMDNEGDAHALTWLPKQLPSNVRLVVSTLEGDCLNALKQASCKPTELVVEPLDKEIRKDVVSKHLVEYNKTLDDIQLSLLVEKSDSGRPLYLSVACEELRVFGDFKKLTDKISSLSPDLPGLLQQVLQRIVEENGEELVVATLCLIETSRFGLLETELLELLAFSPKLPQDSDKPNTKDYVILPMIHWALVYLGLRPFLRPSGNDGEGRLDFYHRTVSKAVRGLYLQSEDTCLWWHKRLADFFENCTDAERKAEELPYHLEKIASTERMKQCLLQKPVFDQLYTEDNKVQLMAYWRFAGGYDVAAKENRTALNTYLQENSLQTSEQIQPLQVKLAWFLVDIGEYTSAESLLQEAIQRVEAEHDTQSQLLCEPLFAMVTLFYLQALKVVYSSSPVYRKCKDMGSFYSRKCVQIHKRHLTADDVQLGKVLLLCGYFDRTYLSQAETIFKKHGYKQGLAEVLYFQGESKQYDSNMDVPIRMFEESLDLCKTHFGRYHTKTARCYQLFGQLYWNLYVSKTNRRDWLEKCLDHYKQEVYIMEVILGMVHPNTVRSREDVIIILQTLNRDSEAEELLKLQPSDKEV